jgi:hypothetical protein
MTRSFILPAIACAVAASAAIGGVVNISVSSNSSLKRVTASYDDGVEKMVTIRVLSKSSSSAPWVISSPMTTSAVNGKNVAEPLREELEIWSAITTDCNANGIPDGTDITNGAADFDSDWIPDTCEYRIGDLNLNGVIDQQDLSILLGWWGITNPLYGDLNFDGVVNGTDVGIILGRYGAVVY